ncbi:MAG TPA: ribosome small subunit-dependent GTPase A [Candidatus Eisenbacteria bacterium]|nr:ribosome small subunit-dependent GTPase A [Candidatus Eisenbacteria bacterium]
MRELKHDQAVILKGVAGQYHLHRYSPIFNGVAVPRGIFRKQNISPLPGDIVEYSKSGNPETPYLINKILPRKNQLKRPPMVNLDVLLITVSTVLPAPDFYLLDRLSAYAVMLSIQPFFLLTKMDMLEPNPRILKRILDNYRPAQFPVYQLGFHDQKELKRLKKDIAGQVVAFAGQSGAGKSTLINRLFNQDLMETGALSKKAGRGRQMTRHIELFPFENSYVADTPGFQTINLEELDLDPFKFANSYPEIKYLSAFCRFNNCTHSHEPGCAVLSAEEKEMHPERLKRYQFLRKEIEEYNKY